MTRGGLSALNASQLYDEMMLLTTPRSGVFRDRQRLTAEAPGCAVGWAAAGSVLSNNDGKRHTGPLYSNNLVLFMRPLRNVSQAWIFIAFSFKLTELLRV